MTNNTGRPQKEQHRATSERTTWSQLMTNNTGRPQNEQHRATSPQGYITLKRVGHSFIQALHSPRGHVILQKGVTSERTTRSELITNNTGQPQNEQHGVISGRTTQGHLRTNNTGSLQDEQHRVTSGRITQGHFRMNNTVTLERTTPTRSPQD